MKIKIATVCSGIGSPEVALKNLGINHTITFACEIDRFARETYLANHDCETMYQDMTAESWEGEKYYSDLFIGGIPCQSFSLAGKRLGELDPRGLLFFDFLRYVKNQQPKYFIIENVKGLLSDAGGETFQNWIHLLGQSVNGNAFFFPHEDSLMYNLHWQVLNTKDYGLPQNRERVFLVGIRNDLPNSFVFPKGIPLKLRLKDILEDEVDKKYYLSEKTIANFNFNQEKKETTNLQGNEYINTIRTSGRGSYDLQHNWDMIIELGKLNSSQDGRVFNTDGISQCLSSGNNNSPKILTNVNPSGNGMNGNVFSDEGLCPTLTTNKGEGIQIQSATKSGYEIATEVRPVQLNKSKNFAETSKLIGDENQEAFCIRASQPNGIMIGAMRGRNPENTSDRTPGAPTQQMLEINENGTSNCLTSVQKDNLVIQINPSLESGGKQPYQQNRVYDGNGITPALCRGKSDLNVVYTGIAVHPLSKKLEFDGFKDGNSPALLATDYKAPKCVQYSDFRIRKLTPLECFRLQGFPDEFLQNAIDAGVSNSQLYKQAGNTISVPVIQAILKNLLK